jgi:hypothetical protein
VLNLDTDEEQTYRIVGDDEADFKQNLISVNSPIARGLIGKEQDDVVSSVHRAAKSNTKLSRLSTFNHFDAKMLMDCKKEKGRIAAFYQRQEHGILLVCPQKSLVLHKVCVNSGYS